MLHALRTCSEDWNWSWSAKFSTCRKQTLVTCWLLLHYCRVNSRPFIYSSFKLYVHMYFAYRKLVRLCHSMHISDYPNCWLELQMFSVPIIPHHRYEYPTSSFGIQNAYKRNVQQIFHCCIYILVAGKYLRNRCLSTEPLQCINKVWNFFPVEFLRR
jgi:hypothetical protein